MANATIKITQLPNIGNNLGANTLLPVVDTSGTAVTDKVTVGNVANFILTEAGNLLPEAFVAQMSYTVANAAQPNITSVGNLSGLTITNLANFNLPGGDNGYVLQTDGDGNLSWTAQTGNGGNGSPGGSNTQVQFNDGGNFGASANLTFDKSLNQLSVLSGSQVLGNVGATPSPVANSVVVYNTAPGAGATGLYVVSSTTNDEVTAYNKAKLLAIIL